jgi:hypothetical protein
MGAGMAEVEGSDVEVRLEDGRSLHMRVSAVTAFTGGCGAVY